MFAMKRKEYLVKSARHFSGKKGPPTDRAEISGDLFDDHFNRTSGATKDARNYIRLRLTWAVAQAPLYLRFLRLRFFQSDCHSFASGT